MCIRLVRVHQVHVHLGITRKFDNFKIIIQWVYGLHGFFLIFTMTYGAVNMENWARFLKSSQF